jgi:hypothetical protein
MTILVVMAGLDPAIQTPKASVWMPGSRPGMTGESITTGLGKRAAGGASTAGYQDPNPVCRILCEFV